MLEELQGEAKVAGVEGAGGGGGEEFIGDEVSEIMGKADFIVFLGHCEDFSVFFE